MQVTVKWPQAMLYWKGFEKDVRNFLRHAALANNLNLTAWSKPDYYSHFQSLRMCSAAMAWIS